jgi:glycerol-3-phosphate dehydrogenase
VAADCAPGGATGAGAALDAATRGLKTALVEADDFAAGTSSRSTKLIHGGVRYLEKAVFQARGPSPSSLRLHPARSGADTPPPAQLDYGQLKLVFEALHERQHLLQAAPHLTQPLPTMMPCYQLWEVPYFWLGLKAYDLVAGRAALTWSHFASADASRALFPGLSPQRPGGETLQGTVRMSKGVRLRCAMPYPCPTQIIYYDGQMDDARINVALATTAAMAGAVVANHVRVVDLRKVGGSAVHGSHAADRPFLFCRMSRAPFGA